MASGSDRPPKGCQVGWRVVRRKLHLTAATTLPLLVRTEPPNLPVQACAQAHKRLPSLSLNSVLSLSISDDGMSHVDRLRTSFASSADNPLLQSVQS